MEPTHGMLFTQRDMASLIAFVAGEIHGSAIGVNDQGEVDVALIDAPAVLSDFLKRRGQELPDDEPMLLLRGRTYAASEITHAAADAAEQAGEHPDHVGAFRSVAADMKQFREAKPHRAPMAVHDADPPKSRKSKRGNR